MTPGASARPGSSRTDGRRARWKIAARKVALYLVALALLVAADPMPVTFVIGCALVAAGLAVRVWAFGYLRKNQSLVTSGPYAHCRNPAYLGSALAASGLFVAAGNPFSWAGAGVWIAGVAGLGVFFFSYLPRKYALEYSRLESAFGEPARDYARNVPHFFPRPRPWAGARYSRFCWSQVAVNHEWPWAPIAALALALMWI